MESVQNRLGHDAMASWNIVTVELGSVIAEFRLRDARAEAGMWSALIVQPRDQIPIKLRREECAIRGTRGTGGVSRCEESATDTA
jgi:hypothetical protein